jgi:hypothetical protein
VNTVNVEPGEPATDFAAQAVRFNEIVATHLNALWVECNAVADGELSPLFVFGLALEDYSRWRCPRVLAHACWPAKPSQL